MRNSTKILPHVIRLLEHSRLARSNTAGTRAAASVLHCKPLARIVQGSGPGKGRTFEGRAAVAGPDAGSARAFQLNPAITAFCQWGLSVMELIWLVRNGC